MLMSVFDLITFGQQVSDLSAPGIFLCGPVKGHPAIVQRGPKVQHHSSSSCAHTRFVMLHSGYMLTQRGPLRSSHSHESWLPCTAGILQAMDVSDAPRQWAATNPPLARMSIDIPPAAAAAAPFVVDVASPVAAVAFPTAAVTAATALIVEEAVDTPAVATAALTLSTMPSHTEIAAAAAEAKAYLAALAALDAVLAQNQTSEAISAVAAAAVSAPYDSAWSSVDSDNLPVQVQLELAAVDAMDLGEVEAVVTHADVAVLKRPSDSLPYDANALLTELQRSQASMTPLSSAEDLSYENFLQGTSSMMAMVAEAEVPGVLAGAREVEALIAQALAEATPVAEAQAVSMAAAVEPVREETYEAFIKGASSLMAAAVVHEVHSAPAPGTLAGAQEVEALIAQALAEAAPAQVVQASTAVEVPVVSAAVPVPVLESGFFVSMARMIGVWLRTVFYLIRAILSLGMWKAPSMA